METQQAERHEKEEKARQLAEEQEKEKKEQEEKRDHAIHLRRDTPLLHLDQLLQPDALLAKSKVCIVCGEGSYPQLKKKATTTAPLLPPTATTKMNLCTGCRLVHYCSKDCQMKHWKGCTIQIGDSNNNNNYSFLLLEGHKSYCQQLQQAQLKKEEETKERRRTAETFLANFPPDMREQMGSVEVIMAAMHMPSTYDQAPSMLRISRVALLGSLYPNPIHTHSPSHTTVKSTTIMDLNHDNKHHLIYTILQQSIRILSYEHVEEESDNGFRIFAIIPDLLVRLSQDQIAYEFIVWNVLHPICNVINRSSSYRNSYKEKQLDCIPPHTFCYQPFTAPTSSADAAAVAGGDAASATSASASPSLTTAGQEVDRSMDTVLVSTMLPLLEKGIVPFQHGLTMLLIKIRLLLHLEVIDSFYTFLGCLQTKRNTNSLFQTFSGNKDVLFSIREYIFIYDRQQFLPLTRFAIREKKQLIEEQIIPLFEVLKKLDATLLKVAITGNVLKASLKPFITIQDPYLKLALSSFAHDSSGKMKLQALGCVA